MSRKRRVLLLGASGQVGTALQRTFAGDDLTALDRTQADLGVPESLREVVRAAKPDVILNAAAYTAVDRAESEPALADTVNHLSARVLAEESHRAGAWLVHYSTDYVFDGSKREPWIETDPTGPLNVYGRTKLDGELAIAAQCERHLILRTSWVFSATGHNFVKTMLRLGRERDVLRVVNDQWGAPTSADALAGATAEIFDRVADAEDARLAGTYHASCAGKTDWRGFAETVLLGAARRQPATWARVEGIPTSSYPTPARRPENSTLDTGKLAATLSVRLPAWQDALDPVLDVLLPAGI